MRKLLREEKRLFYDFSLLFLTLCMFFVAPLSLYAATPGLPFVENFSDSNLKDQIKTNVKWSTAEQKIYLAWQNKTGNIISEDTVVLDVGGASDETCGIALGDINGDGHLDMVTGNNSSMNKLYLNTGTDIPFNPDTVINITTDADNTRAIAIGDVDGDGDLDVVVGNSGQINKLYLNDGDGDPFNTVTAIAIGTDVDNTYAIVLSDVDGDGDLDVAVGNSGQTNKLYFNDGEGNPFDTGTTIEISADTDDTRSIALGDVDMDGDLDVVVGNSGQINKLYLNDGDGDPFDTGAGTEIGMNTASYRKTYAIAMGDMDGDGCLDVVTGDIDWKVLSFLNDGEGDPFDTAADHELSSGDATSLVLVDVDGDGNIDLIPGKENFGQYIYLGDGNGGWASGFRLSTDIADTYAIAVGDVNGDGTLDVVTGNYYGQMNRLYILKSKRIEEPFIADAEGTTIGMDADGTYAIAVGDINGDGNLDVIAGNYNQTNKLYLSDGEDSPFDTVAGMAIGTDTNSTYSIAIGDMDGDGDLDLVAGNDGQNKLYLNDGDGDPFDTLTAISIGSDTDDTRAIALGDMDGDGDLDVVVGNYHQINKLYLNDGDGNPFDTLTVIPISSDTDWTQSIAIGDVDKDGNLDVVVGNEFGAPNKLYLNNGVGDPFDESTSGSRISNTDNSSSIALVDMDGDDDLDVVVTDNYNINLYLNDGAGDPFDTSIEMEISTNTIAAQCIAVGDINGDGNLDVVASNSYIDKRERWLFLNDGVGEPFDNATAIKIGADGDDTFSVALGDLDGDGYLDIVVGNDTTTNKLYRNNAKIDRCGYIVKTITADPDDTMAIALGDLNGDGRVDLVINSDNQNKLYLNSEYGNSFNIANISTYYYDTRSIALGDLDGDGDLDVVTGNTGSNMTNYYYLNNDEELFTLRNNFWGATDDTRSIALGDLDGDGDLDVVTGNYDSVQANKLYLNNGGGDPFESVMPIPIGSDTDRTTSIVLGDLDGDGDLDLVTGNNGQNKLYLNDGVGDPFDTLGAIPIGSDTDDTLSIALGDMDGDGDLDVVTGNSGQINKLYLNDGDGNPFDTLGAIPIGSDTDDTLSIALGDMDGDSDLDVVTGNSHQNKLYLNDGVGDPFDTVRAIPIGSDSGYHTYSIAISDINGDGDLDVVVGNGASSSINKIYFLGGYNTAHGLVTSLEIDTETENNISNAVLAADAVLPINTQIKYFLSNNGGAKFYQVQPGVEFAFPTQGNDLRWQAELTSLSPMITPKITEIRITNRNIPPVVTGGQEVFYWEDDPPVVIDEFITVTDIDNENLIRATIKINDGYQNGEDILNFTDTAGITGSWNQGAGELTLTGSASVAQYEAALQSIMYVNLDQGNPTPGLRTITFSVNDGIFDSPPVASTVFLTSINDPPAIISYDPDPATIIQGESIELSMNNNPAPAGEIHLTVADPDNNPEDLSLIIQSGDNYSLVGNIITPIENFFGEITIPLIVYDGDDYSNEYILTIQVDDVISPMVLSVAVQVGGLTVDLTFSEPMGAGVTTPVNYIVSGSSRGTLSQNPDNVENLYLNTYRLRWNTGEMVAGGDIKITVSGVEDASGRVIGIPDSGTDTAGGIGNPPATTANPAGGHHYNVQLVALDCVDAESGCAGTYYTTDGTDPSLSSTLYTGAIPIETYTELRFFSVDQAGNREGIQTEVYHIDIPSTISCVLDTGSNIQLGESLRISGLISPAPAGPAPGLGIRLYPPGVTDPAAAIQIPVESHAGGYFEKWIDCEFMDGAGIWKVETTWSGDASHLGADSVQENLTVGIAESNLVLDVIMGETIKINNKPPIGGKFTALPFCDGGDLSGLPITLSITEPGPSGTVHDLQIFTNLNGQFVLDYEVSGFAFDLLGEWTIQASFAGNSNYTSASSTTILVRVVPTAGYAVIIQGKSETGEGLASHLKTTNFVYDTLIGRQLLPDDIEYFSWDVQSPRWDGLPFKADIETAIKQTIRDKMIANAGDLYIIMVDHGWTSSTNPDEGEFYIYPDDPITSTELGQWLDELQADLSGTAAEDRKIILILGFCRAGIFIDEASGLNRVIIASAAADEYSHRGPRDVAFVDGEETIPLRDGEYFVTEFFKAVSYGKSVTAVFETATDLTEIYTSTGSGPVNSLYLDDSAQHPLYDDNEDGIGSNEISFQEGNDGTKGRYLYIGTSPPTGNDPGDVLITQVTEARFMGDTDNSVDLWAQVDFPERLKLIWAEIKEPGYEPGDPGAGYQIEMDTYRQATSLYEDGHYEWLDVNGGTEKPDLFSLPGAYQVFYFAKDLQTGHVSALKESKVYKARPAVWGPYTEANHAPASFSLLVPNTGETVQTNVVLNWEDSSDEDGDPLTYTVLLSKGDVSFVNPILKEGLPYSSCLLTAMDGLEDLSTYYWKVQAIDQYGAVTESNEVRSFYTDNENGPEISIVYAFVLDTLGNVLSNALVDPGSEQANSTGMATLILTSGIHTITANVPGFQPQSQELECMGGEYHLHFMLPNVATVMGDTDGDSDVDGADLVNLITEIDLCTGDCNSDFNGDEVVDQDDLGFFSAEFGL